MFVGIIVWAAFEHSKDYPWTEVGCVHSPGQLQQTSMGSRWVCTNIRMRMDVQMFVSLCILDLLPCLLVCLAYHQACRGHELLKQ